MQNEIDGACVAYGEEESSIPGFCGENWGKETTSQKQVSVGG